MNSAGFTEIHVPHGLHLRQFRHCCMSSMEGLGAVVPKLTEGKAHCTLYLGCHCDEVPFQNTRERYLTRETNLYKQCSAIALSLLEILNGLAVCG